MRMGTRQIGLGTALACAVLAFAPPGAAQSRECARLLEPEAVRAAEPEPLAALIARCDLGALRSAEGETPLHIAAAHAGTADAVEAVLGAGVGPEKTTKAGKTALHYLAETGTVPAVAALLVVYGAEVDAMFDWVDSLLFGRQGTTPLHLAAAREDGAPIVAALLASGADADAENKAGRTALHIAARTARDTRVIDLLLANGAEVNARDGEEATPLHIAARNNPAAAVSRRLLQAGADPDLPHDPKDGTAQTPLRIAAANTGSAPLFALMFEASREPCAKDAGGRAALDYAGRNPALENTPVYWALHDRCADPG